MKIKLNKKQVNVLMMLISFFSFFTLSAQIENTKIKDGTVSTSPQKAMSGAILELESNNKGMLMPRLTTAQRDAIPLANLTPGLLIFNTTTECFDFWNGINQLWFSLCGTLPPAAYNIAAGGCSKIETSGTFKQGVALAQSNFMTIPVTVTQRGTYSISAVSIGSGYYFVDNGSFPTPGNYVLYLKGVGTPNRGYPGNPGDPGDTFNINLGQGTVCSTNIWVEESHVDYTLDCASKNILGDYFAGVPLTSSNKITLQVDPADTNGPNAFWSINTNTLNGYSFKGTGTFTGTAPQTIELFGTGTPVLSGTNNFTISSNAVSLGTCSPVTVNVAPVGYTIDCSTAVVNGNYMQDVTLNSGNTITLPVNVTATGQTTLSTNTVNGISYSSGLVTLNTLGPRNIILTGSGTPAIPGTTALTLTGTPGAASNCSLSIAVASQPVTYTTNCSGITTSGSYAPGITMTAANTMTIPVNVTYVGNYSITTNTVNGVSFSKTGTFSSTGAQNVVLEAIGTPISGGNFSYTISANSTNGSTSCSKIVNYVFRTMKVLGLGGGIYQPASAGTGDVAKAILNSTANFGPTGTLQVQGITLIDGAYGFGTTLKNLINSNNIDIIVTGYNYYLDAATIAVLNDFVKNKKGVLIYSQKSQTAEEANLSNAIFGTSSIAFTAAGATYTNPILNVSDPILEGPFGSIKGLYTGTDYTNAHFATNLPANAKALVTQQGDATRVWSFKHTTLGFMFIGDSGWIGGNSTDAGTYYYPSKVTSTGLPVPKPYNGGISVQNSIFYANAMAWAIKYAQENINSSYVIP